MSGPSAAAQSQQRFLQTPIASLLSDFVTRGFVILGPDAVGAPPALHQTVYHKELAAFRAKTYITTNVIPEVLDVLAAPGLVAAVDRLLGPGWAIVPFTHNTPFVSGAFDQHWHKDDNGPYNGRWPRHHQAVQIELLYFPQTVLPDMGPTAILPYSQYWTFNHEENQDNFAGADHLDFDYQLIGMEHVPVSGPRSRYDPGAIREATTEHDTRMREAPVRTGWPLMQQFEAAPLEAGSVVIYSHNLFHRGNHRRDDFANWRANPRFMWRFWLYRTHDPVPVAQAEPWQPPTRDPITGTDLRVANPDLTAIWSHQYAWATASDRALESSDPDVESLRERLYRPGDAAEPERLGAAYRLAASADAEHALGLLAAALRDERESVRRAATFGLVAMGDSATTTFLAAVRSERKWLRKAAAFGLGDAADLTPQVLAALGGLLAHDASVYVRSVAAHALGCLARRSLARAAGLDLLPDCARALVACLARERNRLGMDKAQGRSIKFTRPTDESDLCEGIGVTYRVARFAPVRSAVRENALVSLVILCSHSPSHLGDALEAVIEALTGVAYDDDNVFATGLALDALARLLAAPAGTQAAIDRLRARADALFATSPILCLESLQRSGVGWTAREGWNTPYGHFD